MTQLTLFDLESTLSTTITPAPAPAPAPVDTRWVLCYTDDEGNKGYFKTEYGYHGNKILTLYPDAEGCFVRGATPKHYKTKHGALVAIGQYRTRKGCPVDLHAVKIEKRNGRWGLA